VSLFGRGFDSRRLQCANPRPWRGFSAFRAVLYNFTFENFSNNQSSSATGIFADGKAVLATLLCRRRFLMATTATMATMIKMLESLPEQVQERVMEHLREYIEEIRDEANWNNSFAKSQNKLIAAAKQARKDVKSGKSEPMDLKKL